MILCVKFIALHCRLEPTRSAMPPVFEVKIERLASIKSAFGPFEWLSLSSERRLFKTSFLINVQTVY